MTNQKTLDFIREHIDDDVKLLALQGCKEPDVDMVYALHQIAGHQKAKTKIPSWAAMANVVYPPHLAMEQCSSEATARYKAQIAGKGQFFVDLTAGFGVDMAFISQGFKQAVHVERQEQLCAISSHNYKLLGLNHIEVVCGDGVSYLHTMPHADLIYIDPARRDEHGARTYGIADCTPNVLELLDEMLEKADRLMIKLSPMLDWRKAVADVRFAREVHIVSVDNECKELLLVVSRQEAPLKVFCVNNNEVFKYDLQEQEPCAMPLPESFRFLYEPNASVMKAGCFDLIARRFGVVQLDKNSHLFVSETEAGAFPGRHFIIEKIVSMNKRELKMALEGIDRANIAVRNFPMSVAELRKRLRLKDGGDVYIFATTVSRQGHQLLICRKKS
ncbi:MAG: SAM-dependent methyltransferase [Prevotella sp.]|nr:SAM-dependent methyltransferase [Prevotella sp.]